MLKKYLILKIHGKIMTEFVALRPKTYRYLIDGNEENKTAKGTIKKML